MRLRLCWRLSDSAARALPILAVLAALGWGLRCTMPELTRVEGDSFPRADACADCHVEIHREWARSGHAAAWTNPHFRQATDDRRFAKCLGCHAPQPGYAATQPAVRAAGRESGVTCVCCHLEAGTLAGPIRPGGLVSPHPVAVQADRYRASQFCGRCHEGTLAQWKQARQPDTPTCQDCHMPAVRRKMTQATGPMSELIVAFERADDHKRHTFDPAPYEAPGRACQLAVDVTWAEKNTKAIVTLRNGLPHNLPTGDFGVRVVVVEASQIGPDGQATPLGRWELTRSGDGAIPSGGKRSWPVTVSPGAKALRVTLSRRGPDNVPLTERPPVEVPVP